jgi:hypothetical protein
MRIPTFTFKNEAIWMVLLAIVPVAIGVIILVVIRLLR